MSKWQIGSDPRQIVTPRGNIVAEVWPTWPKKKRREIANTIAAAPELLAGAREAIAAWDMEEDTPQWNHEDRLEHAISLLRAAIGKAKGRDQ